MAVKDSYVDTIADGDQLNDGYFNGIRTTPIGGIIAWLKSYANTPSLPSGWVECNGQTLSDADSPYNGQIIPNLNGSGGGTQRFLRGSTTSGTTGGSETHQHSTTSGSGGLGLASGTESPSTGLTSTLPSYYEIVWIIRVK